MGEAVARKVDKATTQPVGLKRFSYMRFYLATMALPKEPGLWESLFSYSADKLHARALAVYLFNMHISSQMYHQDPSQLTLNYLGVLDGLVRGPHPFKMSQTRAFYKKNQTQIDGLLKQFMQNVPAELATPITPAQKQRWLELLERQPQRAHKPIYFLPANNMLRAEIPAEVYKKLNLIMKQGAEQAKRQVVTYDVADVQLEDLDSKLVHHAQRRKQTYRWVKDECYYSSYLLGKLVSGQVSGQLPWDTRVYLITAMPKSGEFLVPADNGSRFTLANGTKGLHWRYHTALLVVVPYQGLHIPVVLDSFLGGRPVSLDSWLSYFSWQTVLSVVPFSRENMTEKALHISTKLDGARIRVGKTVYDPAPVEK